MLKFISPLILFLLIVSCNSKEELVLKNGDLLFLGSVAGELSEAINTVTQTEKATNYSHIALVEKTDQEIWVLHAAPENGSERISLQDFLTYAKKDSSTVVAYRIKPEIHFDASRAIQKAQQMLGKPYNYSYILTDTAYYCSDFVYRAFEEDNIFTLEPMTFKDPISGTIHPTWVSHYEKMGLQVPEGLLGCNPNGMAASAKIEKIGILQQP
jgi:hypothetical protein